MCSRGKGCATLSPRLNAVSVIGSRFAARAKPGCLRWTGSVSRSSTHRARRCCGASGAGPSPGSRNSHAARLIPEILTIDPVSAHLSLFCLSLRGMARSAKVSFSWSSPRQPVCHPMTTISPAEKNVRPGYIPALRTACFGIGFTAFRRLRPQLHH